MNILVGFDGTEESKQALKLAQKHAKARQATIHVASAISRIIPLDFTLIQKAEQDLDYDVSEILNDDNVSFETHLLVDNASVGEQLVDFANKKKIDEIIIGARKRSRVGKFIMGSTTQHVVLNAPCPVVTVK